MSKTVDERVVEMQFDNKAFEKNVQISMSTLDKLKQSLNFTGAAKGFENINTAAKNVNMSPFSDGIEAVRVKFSALEVMAVTVLSNITNSVVNTGKRIASALTIDPIKTGFQEYETQINAVQTILANTSSKGTSLQQVNAALAELNTYADKTIYNFTEMTRNIGTFTAAGTDLKTSVAAIKGIANVAAVSGSTSQQASTAMYQLSQALAAGTVKLMDWNSVVNAGMGGQVFQDALKETARVMKKTSKDYSFDVDAIIKKNGSFRESLTEGWITSEVLTQTLAKFTGDLSEAQLTSMGYTEEQIKGIIKMGQTANDAATKVKTFTQLWDTLKEAAQSGWTKSWEIMVGDFDEAKELLTEISKVIGDILGKSADARNAFLLEGLGTGWKQLLGQGITDEQKYIETIKEVARESGDAFDTMIEDSGSFGDALKKGLKDGTLNSDTLKEAVIRLSDKMSNMSAEEMIAEGYTKDHIKAIKELSDGLKNGSVSMGEFVSKINKPSGRENVIQALWNSFNALLSVLSPIKEAFRDVFPAATGEQLYKITENIRDFTAKMKLSDEQTRKIKDTFKGLFSIGDAGVSIVTKIATSLITLAGNFNGIGDAVLNVTSYIGNWLTGISEAAQSTNLFGDSIDKVATFIQNAIDKMKGFFSVCKEKIDVSGFDGFLNTIKNIWTCIKDIGGKIADVGKQIGNAFLNAFRSGDLEKGIGILNGGLLASILVGFKKILDGGVLDGIKSVIEAVTSPLDKLKDSIAPVTGMLDTLRGCLQAYQQDLKAKTLLKIAGAIALLAVALLVIAMIDPPKLLGAIAAITALFSELMLAMTIFDKIGGAGQISKASASMIGLSVAVLILASALKKISEISPEKLTSSLVGVFTLMAIVVGAAKAMETDGAKAVKGASQMVIMAVALNVLVVACEKLAKLEPEQLVKGVSGILGLTGILVAAAKIMDSESKSITKFAGQMLLMSGAIGALAYIGTQLSSLSPEQLINGGAGLLGITTILVTAAKVMDSESKSITKFAGQMLIMSAAIGALAYIGIQLSALDPVQLAKGGAGLLGITTILVAASKIMSSGKGSAAGAGQMLVMSAAIGVMAVALKSLSELKLVDIGKGLLAISGAMAVLVVGLNLMNGTLAGSAALLAAALALGVLTPVLMVLGGMPIINIVTGLAAMAGVFAVLGLAGVLLAPLTPVILSLSAAVALFGVGCLATGAGISMLAAGFTALAIALTANVAAISSSLLTLLKSFGDALVLIFNGIATAAPAIGAAVKAVVLTLVDVLMECVPTLAEGAMALIIGVLDVLIKYEPQIIGKLITLFATLLTTLTSRAGELVDLLVGFVIAIINGVTSRAAEVIAAGVKLISAVLKGICDAITPLVKSFIEPALKMLSDIITSFSTLISETLSSVAEIFNSVFTGISDIITSVGTAIKSILDGIADIISSVGEAALNAGLGFESMANGIKIITELSLLDIAASLTAVAVGLSQIASHSNGLAEAGNGMQQIASGTAMSTSAFSLMAGRIANVISLLLSITPASVSVANSLIVLQTGFSGMYASVNATMSSMAITVTNISNRVLVTISNMLSKLNTEVVTNSRKIVSEVESTMIKSLTAISSKTGDFLSAAASLMKSFSSGIKTELDKLPKTISDVLTYCVTAIKSNHSDFSTAGEYLGDGLIAGINGRQHAVYNAGYALGQAAVRGEKDGQHSKSPSKDTEKAGVWLGEGLIVGLVKMGKAVYNAGKSMGTDAVNSISGALSTVANGDFDVKPTISPVLDMSNAKAENINFGTVIDGLLSKPMDSLSQIIAGAQAEINASNNKVISAIAELREDINTYLSSPEPEVALYVDGNKLATSLAKPMNRQLSVLAKRGAY